MDPIHPIAPGSHAIARMGRMPVERLERVARERDRPAKDGQERKRRAPTPQPEPPPDDDGRVHVDVRV